MYSNGFSFLGGTLMGQHPVWKVLSVISIFLASVDIAAENRVEATLKTNVETAVSGSTIKAGVLFDLPEKAHIYWRNPGDSGLATGIEWDVDGSTTAGALKWPAPSQFSVEGLDEAYFGYTRQVLLYADFEISADVTTNTVLTIRAKAHWLLCLDDGVCIPEDQVLSITIPVHDESRPANDASLFLEYAKTIPVKLSNTPLAGRATWSQSGDKFLEIELLQGLNLRDNPSAQIPRFYPDTGGAWAMETEKGEGAGIKIRFRPVYKGDALCGGVLVLPLVYGGGTPKVRFIKVDGPKKP